MAVLHASLRYPFLAADVQPFALHWAFNPLLVLLGVIGAGALVFYLYRAQQRVASKRIVTTLTAIRITLIVLMLILLAGPVYQWRHARQSGGTLYVLVDSSLSMDHADRQMTPVEQLHWADALSLLPDKSRPSQLGRRVVELDALRADLAHLETRSQFASPEPDVQTRIGVLTKQLASWNAQLERLAGKIEPSNAPSANALRDTSAKFKKSVEKAADRDTFDAAAADVPWAETLKELDASLATLRPLAEKSDATFLAEKKSDPKIQEALAKVAGKKRIDLAVEAVTRKGSLVDVPVGQTVKIVAFADAPLAVGSDDLHKSPIQATGHATDLAGALRWVNEQIGPDERASVVVVSDGRQTGTTNGADLVEPARLLASRDVRVFTVGIGSTQVAADAAVEQLDAPDWVYKDDTLRAAALLRLDGLSGKPVTVEFRRAGSIGTPIKSETFTPASDRATKIVRFDDKPTEVGMLEYEIAIKPIADEAVPENNSQRLRVTVKKDKLNALVIDDQPRWEFRYLTNYLERDQRVKLQKVLFQPASIANVDRPQPVMASPTNATAEAQLLPDTPEKWSAFDLIVIGDVPPERLSDEQQANIAKAVRDRGAALVFIAGPFNLPSRYTAAKNLHDVLPVELVSAWTAQDVAGVIKDGFRPTLAPDGVGSVLSQFTFDESANADHWAALPPWYWHSEQTRAKLAASVIWTVGDAKPSAPPLTREQTRQRALLATMPMGLGRVMYLASDSTWRLRQVGGENLHERFWGQVVRWAVGNDLPAGGRLVKFGTDKPRYAAGEPVTVTARLLDKNMSPLRGKTVSVAARSADGKRVNETVLAESPEAPGYYRGTIASLPVGAVELTLIGKEVEDNLAADPTVVAKSLSLDILPHRDDERHNINADFAALARVAEAGGGLAVTGPNADLIAEHLPRESYVSPKVEQAGLFSSSHDGATWFVHWGFMAAFIALLTAEWIIRKAGGLV